MRWQARACAWAVGWRCHTSFCCRLCVAVSNLKHLPFLLYPVALTCLVVQVIKCAGGGRQEVGFEKGGQEGARVVEADVSAEPSPGRKKTTNGKCSRPYAVLHHHSVARNCHSSLWKRSQS